MSDAKPNGEHENILPEPDQTLSFSTPPELVPILMLEQLIQIRALLATGVIALIDISAEVGDKNELRRNYAETLTGFQKLYAEQVRDSVAQRE